MSNRPRKTSRPYKISLRQKWPGPKAARIIRALRKESRSYGHIAEEFGVSRQYVHQLRVRAGL